MSTTNYHIGRGPLYIADRDASGNPGALEDVGEVMISIEISKEYKDNFTTRYEVNHKDAHVPVSQEVKGTLTLKERTAKTLQHILHGTKTAEAGGALTNQAFPAGVAAGEEYPLPGFAGKVSALTIKDSAGGGGATLTLGTHYTVDLTYGRVKFLDVTGFTQPLKANFTNAAAVRNSILTKRVVNKYLRFEGINVGNNDGPTRFLAELYNCTLHPAQKDDLKSEDYATYEISFECLVDPNKSAADTEFGQYGSYLALD